MNYPKKPTGNSDPNTPGKQPSSTLTLILFAALALWIISIASGTLLFGEVEDWRKPILVLLPMAAFLTLWGGLLLRKYLEAKREL